MRFIFNNEKSLIKEIEVFTPDKESQAIIFTPENISVEEIAKIKQDMEQNCYKVLAGEYENQAVLKVYGFDSANNLLASMANDGAVFGDFQTSKTALDEHEKDKGDNSKLALFGAGACFTIASTAIAAAGGIRKSGGEIFQGVAGIVPAIGLMWSSQQTPESQMSYLYRDLREFAQANNLRISHDVRAIMNQHEAPDDFFHNFQRGVFENGPSANNLIKAIAVTAGTLGAVEQKNWYKAAGNAIFVSGMLAANALPEEHITTQDSVYLGNENGKQAGEISEPPTKKKGFIGETIDGMKANPQRIAGTLALVQQALKAVGNELHDKKAKADFKIEYKQNYTVYEEQRNTAMEKAVDAKRLETPNLEDVKKYTKEVQEFGNNLADLDKKNTKYENYAKAVPYDQISMGAYVAGYSLYTMTKKHNGSKLELDPVIEVCANMVNDYPADQQKAVTQRLATFLGNHSYVEENVDELVSQINHKMAVLAQSLWAGNEPANNIVKFDYATRLDGAKQEQVEMAWQGEKPNSNVLEAKKQELEKLVTPELQPSPAAMSV